MEGQGSDCYPFKVPSWLLPGGTEGEKTANLRKAGDLNHTALEYTAPQLPTNSDEMSESSEFMKVYISVQEINGK
jgi:hypothetical protein